MYVCMFVCMLLIEFVLLYVIVLKLSHNCCPFGGGGGALAFEGVASNKGKVAAVDKPQWRTF